MSTSSDSVRETLSKNLDELATQAMLAEGDLQAIAPLLAALGDLAGQAESAGLQEISSAARELSTAAAPGNDEFLAGLARLQETLQRTARTGSKPPAVSIAADRELLSDFIVEARDHLSSIETNVLALEQNPSAVDPVHTIFRGFHTIKGLAGFLELPAMQQSAHEVESLLDRVRNGTMAVTPALVDVVLAGADYLKTEVSRVEALLGGAAPAEPASNVALLEKVRELMSGKPAEPSPAPTAPAESRPSEAPANEARKSEATESRLVKVDTAKLDFLVDMVGEIVIAQSMIRHDGNLVSTGHAKLQRNLAHLAHITGEVQKTAMSMRMVPIGQLFQKSARLIRDLTRKSGKRIDLDLVGEETQLDRTIVDELADPLMHMIRNAADHGIELPEERSRAGKNPAARIGLKAYHQAGHIAVEVSDDGRGLSREKILTKARERGLVQDGTGLADKEVFNLIFEPGFSTAEKVTDLSGRGVGMDVVRRQVQKMRGRVDIESKLGSGTTFVIKLPLTLAIIDGLVVGVGEQRYIVPIFVVHEIFQPRPETIFTVEGRKEMMLIRGSLLPVVRLHERFSVQPRSTDLTKCVVVVAEAHAKRFCLVVDELIGKHEVVIKNLGAMFKHLPGVAGGAILGDGRVGLIVDMDGVFGDLAHA
jgi:two-component system, chemotaxis family, sensor kinase CheA